MWYFAEHLRGSLLETLAWLRPDTAAAALLDQVDAGQADSEEPTHAEGVAAYLEALRVVNARLPDQLMAVDITNPTVLAHLDTDLNVEPLITSELGTVEIGVAHRASRPHLNQSIIRSASQFGRDITQHCSLAIWDRDVDVIAYRSQHDDTERCFAVYSHVNVTFDNPSPLSPAVPEHHAVVNDVAQLWSIPLDHWT